LIYRFEKSIEAEPRYGIEPETFSLPWRRSAD
jgi:hypothetical protein